WQAKRFTPGDADRYRFEARKGQRLVIAAAARELVPYLADAVPGWFQATLALYDARGKELAFEDDYRFHPDPVVLFEVPKDGQYVIEIKDAIYRGRPDFVYRITIGEIPFVTSIFPLGGPAGGQTTVELTGWNLPVDKLTMDTRDKVSAVHPLSVRKGDTISNTVPFAVGRLPECLEKESNDSPPAAQSVTLPTIVNGRVDGSGDWDVFRIEGRAGEQVVAEVTARRLASPLDSVLELTDAAGKRLAFNDDHDDKADALNTHHADSLIHVTLPADGTYFLRLGDARQEGGPQYAYRLRISPPRPDFALRVVPSAINAESWRLKPITIFALRKDRFDGEIALSFRGDPEGVLMDGGLVPAGQKTSA
ncbi:MAG: peptidase, partial [Candidatus Nealsonbacteria bacterium]|nr:peptidase [Candidatus Nealsonbacteria bacterium]